MKPSTKRMLQLTLLINFAMLMTPTLLAGPVSELKNDETLVLFNSNAWFDPDTKQWHIPIHGWVYEPADSKIRKKTIAKSLKSLFNLAPTKATEVNFKQRVNLLLADNERGKSMVVRFANRSYAIEPSAANGHFKTTIKVSDDILEAAQITEHFTYQAVLDHQDKRVFSGHVNLLPPSGVSVISDIDDTIKISQVTNKRALLNHTFLLDFMAVQGMSDLYRQWQQDHGTAIHWVSSSPWQLYPELSDFIQQAGFPDGEFNLKTVRFKDRSLLNLFKSGTETKPPVIVDILQHYPNRQFILVGDSGEQDPEVYALIQQQHPNQIKQILIRNVSNETLDNARFAKLLAASEANLWQLFTAPNEIIPVF